MSSSNPDGRPAQQPAQMANDAASTDTMILYRHFLAKLYVAIKTEISAELDRIKVPWANARIEFIFSVPATWNDIRGTLGRIASKLEEVAKAADFGCESRHSVSIGLTEPEAAAASSLDAERLMRDIDKMNCMIGEKTSRNASFLFLCW